MRTQEVYTLIIAKINSTATISAGWQTSIVRKNDFSFCEVMNISINQTLGRTINTSIATLISIVAIIFGGATELFDFAYVLIFGVFIGTYSSVFIAAPVVEIYGNLEKKSI